MEVGQKVRIKKDLYKIAKDIGCSIYENEIMEISEVIKEKEKTYYKIGDWYYIEEMLEPINEPKIEINADGIIFKNVSASKPILSINQSEYVTKVLGIKERNDDEMKRILEVYKNKKEKEIVDKYRTMMNEVKEKDVYLKEVIAFNKKINELYNSGKIKNSYIVGIEESNVSPKTKAKLDELKDQIQDEKEKVFALVDEVEAQIELCDTYDQKINVLVKYGIIDKESMKVL